jgi:hypothetical protein
VSEVEELKRSVEDLSASVILMAKTLGTRLSREQMCARLGVHRNTLARWIELGIVPPPRHHNKWLLSVVLEWETSGRLTAFLYKPMKRGFHLYRHFDSNGVLLYVGVSISAVSRLRAHKQSAHWFWSIANVTVQSFNTREESLAAEKEAIKTERPLFNITHSTIRATKAVYQ